MSKPINVYAIPELRQTLDESLPGIFARLNYKQCFDLIDRKLYIGYSIAVVAGISFLLDKQFSYKEVVNYQALLVGAYVLLSTAFWFYTKYVERGIKYVGVNKDGLRLFVKSYFQNGKPDYWVEFESNKGTRVKTKLAVNKVFNEAGYLQNNLLYQWIEEQLKTLESKKIQ